MLRVKEMCLGRTKTIIVTKNMLQDQQIKPPLLVIIAKQYYAMNTEVKHMHAITSIKQPPVLKGHIFLVLS